MGEKKPVKKPVLLLLLIAVGLGLCYAQGRSISPEEHIKAGVSFYSEGKFAETSARMRLAGPVPEALYWLSLAELSMGNFNEAIAALDMLEQVDQSSRWSREVPYHRGRCLFYLHQYEAALLAFISYSYFLEPEDPRMAASYFWAGECFYALGYMDNAANSFSMIIEKYPYSAKYEGASYRLSLINQKKIETELLTIIKWSHEESLKSLVEYREREKLYEQAIAAYRQRIDELLAKTGTQENETPAPLDNDNQTTIQELRTTTEELNAILNTMLNDGEP
ncbi:MAG: tetratricopeptide repeat protein [Treponema sp.]|jgi:tetratricopeptide (TPR) repeat protein|nr:tetratricopeptide repeat protein [Treponema sp.]